MSSRISLDVTHALDRVVSDNGWLAASRPGPLRASLSDVLGEDAELDRAELDALVVSAEEGVPAQLRTAGRAGAVAMAPDLVQRLVAWGMADELAVSVIEAWVSLVPEVSRPAAVIGDDITVTSGSRREATPPLPAVADRDAGGGGAMEARISPVSGPPAFEAPPPTVGTPPPTSSRFPRFPIWAAATVAVVLVIAAGAWFGLHRDSRRHDGPLLAALADANSGYAMGLIPPGTCTSTRDHVVCVHPDPAVTRLEVRTYPSKSALYQAYLAAAGQLRGSPLQVNVGDCNARLSSGERSWNHAFEHPDMYSIHDHVAQDLTIGDKAQGRLACEVTGSYLTIVWTADAGTMLGEVEGPVMSLFSAWKRIHHGIVPPGSGPMDDMGSGSPSASSSGMGMS